MYPLVRELAADGIPVTVSCRVLKSGSRAAYYRWLDEPFTDAQLDEAHLANAIFDAHRDDPEFGYRFLADEVRLADHDVSDRVVWRICRDMGWWSCFGKPKRPQGFQARARRPMTTWCAGLHRGGAERVVAHRHHRTLDPRGQALPAARSRTCTRTGSSAGPSTRG
jgi:putative transposase